MLALLSITIIIYHSLVAVKCINAMPHQKTCHSTIQPLCRWGREGADVWGCNAVNAGDNNRKKRHASCLWFLISHITLGSHTLPMWFDALIAFGQCFFDETLQHKQKFAQPCERYLLGAKKNKLRSPWWDFSCFSSDLWGETAEFHRRTKKSLKKLGGRKIGNQMDHAKKRLFHSWSWKWKNQNGGPILQRQTPSEHVVSGMPNSKCPRFRLKGKTGANASLKYHYLQHATLIWYAPRRMFLQLLALL